MIWWEQKPDPKAEKAARLEAERTRRSPLTMYWYKSPGALWAHRMAEHERREEAKKAQRG